VYKMMLSILFVLTTLLPSSCMKGGGIYDMLGYNETKNMNMVIERMIEAINEGDKETIKSFFSKSTLEEVDDFDGSVENLFSFIQGTIDSWEKLTGAYTSDSRDHGQRRRIFSSYYHINTDEQQYFFLFDNCSIDTEHPDNVGIYLLLVVKSEDERKIYDGANKILFDSNADGKVEIPRIGIYLPIE